MKQKFSVLVVGVGDMGSSHALGYSKLPGYDIAGFVVANNTARAEKLAGNRGLSIPSYTDFYKAMKEIKPEVVSINTYTDTHTDFSIHAMKAGCHVFMEKPIARTVEEAEKVAAVFRETGRKLVIGYILQSFGREWELHKKFISNMPPLVDCGVHYVDVMCQMTRVKPRIVQGMSARVSDEIDKDKTNYGHLQVIFDDDSVGWYEVGWGPMMSKSAYFVKDVIGPKGCVSIDKDTSAVDPSDVSKHVTVDTIILHSSETDNQGKSAKEDRIIKIEDEPDHNELCKREQEYLYRAIVEDINLKDHVDDAVNSLKICFAAVESYETGKAVHLD
jgi:predicted dehydrogenase